MGTRATCFLPFPCLHLAFPNEMAADEVRRAARVSVNLIASVDHLYHSEAVSIVDMSTCGCRIVAAKDFVEANDKIEISVKLDVDEISRVVTLPGVVKTHLDNPRDETKFAYGIAFEDLDDDEKLLLSAFVYSHMR